MAAIEKLLGIEGEKFAYVKSQKSKYKEVKKYATF